MADFNWVQARANCSAASIFEALKRGVESDTAIRHTLRGEIRGFRFDAEGDRFWVILTGGARRHVVAFRLSNTEIVVMLDDEVFLEATVSLCDDGICRISVKGEPLESWQFRKRALERFFFEL